MLAAFMAIAAFLVVVGGVGVASLQSVAKAYSHITTINLPNIRKVDAMALANRDLRVAANRMRAANASDADVKATVEWLDQAIADFEKVDKDYQSIPFEEGEEPVYKASRQAWDKLMPVVARLRELAGKNDKDNFATRLQIVNHEFVPLAVAHDNKLDDLVAFHDKEITKWKGEALTTAGRGQWFSIGAVLAGFAAALLIGIRFASSLAGTFQDLADRLGKGAGEVASASKMISDAGSELSAAATQQAAALQETVSSVDEVNSMVNKSADNARRSQEVAGTSEGTAARGKETVEQMIRSIEDISRSNTEIMAQIETSNREISEIVKVIAEIGNKTKVINDIVFQTKLLSFNASVEAARAGEHGKGFAVVAEEVGNLAQMSGNAAKEISSMLEGSIQKVEGIVNDTKTKVERLVATGKEKVESGTQTAKRCGQVLDEIVGSVSEVKQMVGEIAQASQEQSQGVNEITKAMQQLDQVTQQNAAAAQQSASASEQLTSNAEGLRQMVQTLLVTVHGTTAAPAAAPEAAERRPAAKAAKAGSSGGKVVQIHAKAKPASTPAQPALKAAAGAGVPAASDARFEDV
jgi:methyl-accepting chemotaxis protein